ncbi:MAG: SCP2 sterol-binding domain-containing protein [Pyrobaculum sp.]
MKFPDREWAEAFCSNLNNSPEYRTSASRWVWDIAFLVVNIPQEVGVGEKAAVKFRLSHGACHGVEFYTDDRVEAPYILEADYKTWIDVITGKFQPIPAIALGRIKLKRGSFATLVQYATAALAMIKEAQKLGL